MAKSQKMFISMSSISPIPNDDLCNWEFINQSDCTYDVISDDDAVFDVQSFDLDESVHSLSGDSSSDHEEQDVDVDDDDDVTDVVDAEQVEEKKDSPIIEDLEKIAVNFTKFDDFNVNLTNFAVNYRDYDVDRYNDDNDDNHDDDDDEDDDGDDMDDDLVPWEVKGLYMRERIKKSEKKSLTKMIKSKKPCRSVRGRYGQYHAVKAY